jgi:PAS domain S-box-containing protein
MPHILLVEDDAIIALAEASVLRRAGYDVSVVHSGEKAIETVAAAAAPPDLVLMDVDLGPGLDGTEAASAILVRHDIPVLFLSSHTEHAMVDKTERITSYGYVVKHAGDTVLLASIHMAFRLHQAYLDLKVQGEELRSTNAKYSISQRTARIGSWEHDFVNGRLWWSEGMYDLLGFPPGNGVSLEAVSPCFSPEELSRFTEAVRRAFAGEEPYSMDYTFIRPDGTVLTIHDEGEVVRDPEGKPVRMYGTTQDITERKAAERQLLESEDRFRTMADSSPGMIWVTDALGEVTMVNRAYCEFFGVMEADLNSPGKWELLIPCEEEDGYIRAFTEASQAHAPFAAQARVRVADGSVRWVDSQALPRFSVEGTFLGYVGNSIDITAAKHVEAALEESESQYKALVEGSPLGIFINQDMQIVYINPAGLTLLGASEPAQVLGRSPLDFFFPQAHERIVTRIAQLSEGGTSVENAEESMRRVDGTMVEVEVAGHQIRYKGRPANQVIVRDLSELRRTMHRLRESEEMFKTIATLSPYHVSMQDRDLRYVMVVNPQLGFTSEELIGRTDHDVLPKAEADELTAVKHHVLATGNLYRLRTSLMSKDGHVEWFEGMFVPRRNAAGEVDGVIGYFRNTTKEP